uniref:Uncharacterized protein n=1 Tax=Oryza glaberrima TaxID=4538 RepID=I1QW88_ORYGL
MTPLAVGSPPPPPPLQPRVVLSPRSRRARLGPKPTARHYGVSRVGHGVPAPAPPSPPPHPMVLRPPLPLAHRDHRARLCRMGCLFESPETEAAAGTTDAGSSSAAASASHGRFLSSTSGQEERRAELEEAT